MCLAYIGLTRRGSHLRVFCGPVEDSSSCEKNGTQNQFNNIFSIYLLLVSLLNYQELTPFSKIQMYTSVCITKQKRLLFDSWAISNSRIIFSTYRCVFCRQYICSMGGIVKMLLKSCSFKVTGCSHFLNIK